MRDEAGPDLDEFALIAKLFAPLAARAPGALGLLDDAAVIPARPGEDLIITKDVLVAGVHFFAEDPPDLIARKLLRVNLSDLAAKGAVPYGYFLGACFPKDTPLAWLEDFAKGLAGDQAIFGIDLLGGDTAAMPGPLTLSLTALGYVPEGQMIQRAGARPGDDLYVSGTIGDGALGLAVLKGEALGLDPADCAQLISRYRCPEPRMALGQALRGQAHACLDVSDGLIADLRHLADVSGVAAVLQLGAVPLSDAGLRWAGQDVQRRLRLATGGDDYELLFAAPAQAAGPLAIAARHTATALTRIGRIKPGRGVTVEGADGAAIEVPVGGYRHF
jgi:thiamine-monophosphate kinase